MPYAINAVHFYYVIFVYYRYIYIYNIYQVIIIMISDKNDPLLLNTVEFLYG